MERGQSLLFLSLAGLVLFGRGGALIDVAAHDGRHRVDKHHLVVCDLALSANFELRLSLALGQLVLVLLLLGLSAGVLLLGGDLLILRVVDHNFRKCV